jgi:hypothetical protein
MVDAKEEYAVCLADISAAIEVDKLTSANLYAESRDDIIDVKVSSFNCLVLASLAIDAVNEVTAAFIAELIAAATFAFGLTVM